jgi:hypothetical protein
VVQVRSRHHAQCTREWCGSSLRALGAGTWCGGCGGHRAWIARRGPLPGAPGQARRAPGRRRVTRPTRGAPPRPRQHEHALDTRATMRGAARADRGARFRRSRRVGQTRVGMSSARGSRASAERLVHRPSPARADRGGPGARRLSGARRARPGAPDSGPRLRVPAIGPPRDPVDTPERKERRRTLVRRRSSHAANLAT